MGERTRELWILISGDILFFIISLWITLLVRYFAWPTGELLSTHLGPFLLLSGVWLFVFYVAGLYDKQTVFLKKMLLGRIAYTQFTNMLIAFVIFIVVPLGIAPKTNLVIYLFISIILITFWRVQLVNYLSPKNQHKAILITGEDEAVDLVDEVNNNERYNYSFVRMVDGSTAEKTEDFESKLLRLIEKENISIIVANPQSPYMEKIMPTLFDMAFLKFEFTFLDFYRVYEDTFDKIPLSSLRYSWFITHVSQARNVLYTWSKRATDIFFAILLLVPTAVIFPLVALAIRIEDKGPLFYKTLRVGQFNAPISIYKFRTKNGSDVGDEALQSVLVDTKVGTFLRKTRIDELPQLLNVLKGDLSFIGPRPEMPALASVYAEKIQYYNARHYIKPGLSGWAQIKDLDAPRGGVDIERTTSKLSYDLFYLKRRSWALDIQIAAKTLSTILMRSGS